MGFISKPEFIIFFNFKVQIECFLMIQMWSGPNHFAVCHPRTDLKICRSPNSFVNIYFLTFFVVVLLHFIQKPDLVFHEKRLLAVCPCLFNHLAGFGYCSYNGRQFYVDFRCLWWGLVLRSGGPLLFHLIKKEIK